MAHPLASPQASPRAAEPWAQTLPPPTPISGDLHDVLPLLALQGRWREIASRCRQATATDTADAMSIAAYHLLALVKLSMLDAAAAELDKLGAWDDPALRSRTAAGSVPSAQQDVVPFALRRIRAELPFCLGRQQESLDRLYQLLQWCQDKEAEAASAAPTSGTGLAGTASGGSIGGSIGGSSGDGAGTAAASAAAVVLQHLWARRRRDVLMVLVNRHCRLQQYISALRLLGRLLTWHPDDVDAWEEVGRVQVLLGDATAAAATLQRVEQLLSSSGGTAGAGQTAAAAGDRQEAQQSRQQRLHRNRGVLCTVQHDYRGAARDFQAALTLDPSDAVAANNHALALLYCNQAPEAAAALHTAFRSAPAAMLQEPIVTNLASMLELGGSPASLAAKQRMADWVATSAPDDFDLSATRTLGA